MEKFKIIKSKAIVVPTDNVDTDQIIPAKFLKTTEKTGLGKCLFYNWRYSEDGKPKNSVFNDRNENIKILIAGKNFGSGSSREHAVWALLDYGFRAVVSPEFGDIFYNNSLKNGLLPIKLDEAKIKKITSESAANPKTVLTIDLEKQTVKTENSSFKFEIDSFRKSCLILGVDELGYIISHEDKIKKYEQRIR